MHVEGEGGREAYPPRVDKCRHTDRHPVQTPSVYAGSGADLHVFVEEDESEEEGREERETGCGWVSLRYGSAFAGVDYAAEREGRGPREHTCVCPCTERGGIPKQVRISGFTYASTESSVSVYYVCIRLVYLSSDSIGIFIAESFYGTTSSRKKRGTKQKKEREDKEETRSLTLHVSSYLVAAVYVHSSQSKNRKIPRRLREAFCLFPLVRSFFPILLLLFFVSMGRWLTWQKVSRGDQ